ncbi:hypothetical protein SCAR479_07757 [Seiridium cardinale]|uniref:Uncharacterized protein n=1 Tax=Seiridium cardinale TaxID=138064 RepID=A0ABR2XPB7_9PEZI
MVALTSLLTLGPALLAAPPAPAPGQSEVGALSLIGDFASIYGIITGTIGLVGFGINIANLKKFHEDEKNDASKTAQIRIYAGELERGKSSRNVTDPLSNVRLPMDGNFRGQIPAMRLRNLRGETLCVHSRSDPTKDDGQIPEGRTVQRPCVLDQKLDGAPSYLDLDAGKYDDTSLCIALVEVKTPADVLTWTWSGDIGRICDYPWYHSNAQISQSPSYRPSCAWLSPEYGTQAMSIYLPGFQAIGNVTRDKDTTKHSRQLIETPDRLCNSPARFAMWKEAYIIDGADAPIFDPILVVDDIKGEEIWQGRQPPARDFTWPGQPESRPIPYAKKRNYPALPKNRVASEAVDVASQQNIHPLQRREIRERQSRFGGRLIMARGPREHRTEATDLCVSLSSHGPDFFSEHEGMFCDMTEKKLWPVCGKQDDVACFDASTHMMRPGMMDNDFGVFSAPVKEYTTVSVWD